MEHVWAQRKAAGVLLTCHACQASEDMPDGRFDQLSHFLSEHRPCDNGT